MDAPRVTYASYLALDELLAAQRPRTDEPDEMLFVVIHQVYELWFKQLLHEGAVLTAALGADETADATRTLQRMLTILKTIVAQVDVLETMLPSRFAAFRGALDSSSGFQSGQFRELEVLLGRRDDRVLAALEPDAAERLRTTLERPSLFDALVAHLARRGHSGSVGAALQSAYRAGGPEAALCERFVDLDEGMMEWRYRHVQMVRRMIGDRPGTGGSAGVGYLSRTLLQPSFPELWAIRDEL